MPISPDETEPQSGPGGKIKRKARPIRFARGQIKPLRMLDQRAQQIQVEAVPDHGVGLGKGGIRSGQAVRGVTSPIPTKLRCPRACPIRLGSIGADARAMAHVA